VTLLRASAGSGKTHALTRRFVQFLLSPTIPRNRLCHILAITFSNNAAKEMKDRILSWLKDIHFRQPENLEQLRAVMADDVESLAGRAEGAIDEILVNYSDFQVRTIDSFMASIYKASAVDLGYSPDFEILMDSEPIIAYGFNRFLRSVRAGRPEARFLEDLLDLMIENKPADAAFPWDPSKSILQELQELYKKLSAVTREVKIPEEVLGAEDIKNGIREAAETLKIMIERSGLELNQNSTFSSILEILKKGSYPDLIGKGLKAPPIRKPRNSAAKGPYEGILEKWEGLGERIRSYTRHHALWYYFPYLKVYQAFQGVLETIKREGGVIFIDDLNKTLSDYLDRHIVPDIYFRIGETVYHYLIDEFQDTSPLQWKNLFPLVENSLAQGGSFFAVGDTKQAIYGFRNADYRIMKSLESENPFPSSRHQIEELDVNYRSGEKVVQFNKAFFRETIPSHEAYGEAAARSGLLDYEQRVKKGNEDSGYVELMVCSKDEEACPEKAHLERILGDLQKRGFRYSDIAVLTFKNEEVVNVTTWLSEMGVPFLSYSSLDARTRKLTAEILFLLTFLDSPPDDLSFGGFLLGECFRRTMDAGEASALLGKLHAFLFENRTRAPLYKAFQEVFPGLWARYFERLFRAAGYLPLYDLVSEIYTTFDLFQNFKDEEATLTKILEAIKKFEGRGNNHPGDFLRAASDQETGESDWNIDIPAGVEAVKVMTIHKAKGLGFPVVIALLYEEQSRGFKYVAREEHEGVVLLKINQKIAEAGPSLNDAYQEERMKEMVNRLNTLYVGFTRPLSELYVIGVTGKRNQFPAPLLKECQFSCERKESHTPALGCVLPSCLPICHQETRSDLTCVSPGGEINLDERRRGEFIHAALAFIDFLDDGLESTVSAAVQRAENKMKSRFSAAHIEKILCTFLRHEGIRPFFLQKNGRIVKRESDFSDGDGTLFRMDRVVVDQDRIAVLDFKTGGEKQAEGKHLLQVKTYLGILGDLYPSRRVEGWIAYVDLKEMVHVL
jgi:ATP-dependent helicase/nuclease subunit A